MSNRADSRQHGYHRIERIRPSKVWRLKKRKEISRQGQRTRHEIILSAVEKTPVFS